MENNKTALVTGASAGIGKAIYKMLIAQGWNVYGTSRKAKAADITPADGGYMVRMDVTDEKSVNDAVKLVTEHARRLDALINNAGMGIAGSVEDTSVDEAKKLFDANFFGTLEVTRACMPHLIKSRGIVVNISSVAGILTVPFQGMYCAGKAALEAASEALRLETAPYGVRVCLVEPGDTKTDFTQNRVWTDDARGSKYESVMKKSIAKMEHDEQNGAPPEAVAKVVCKMLHRKNPPVRRAVGASYKILLFLKRLLPDRLVMWILSLMYAK